MRFIKLGLISVVFLFLVITGMSLLLPSTVNISRAIDINAPIDSVYANINDMAKWRNWYAGYDSSKASISTKTIGEGSSITINKTTIKILKSSPEKISAVWASDNNNPLNGDFNFYKHDSLQTTIQWHFVQHVKWYPWEKFASILSDKAVGPVMEKSLDNLKKSLEKPE